MRSLPHTEPPQHGRKTSALAAHHHHITICMRAKTIDRQHRDWYQLNRHRKRAKHQLAIEPFCAFCMRENRAIPATIADHIEPHNGNWTSFRIGKLQSLCKQCHDRTKRRLELHGFDNAVGEDGMPIDRDHPIYRTPQFRCS